jgi:aspartyl-tRNA synthetase
MKLDPCVKHTQAKPSPSLAGFHAAEIMAGVAFIDLRDASGSAQVVIRDEKVSWLASLPEVVFADYR